MDELSDNTTEILRTLTESEVTLSIPVLCLMTVVMTTGTVGNFLVLMTYCRCMQKASTNLFIFSLALFDIINCCIGIPFDMNDLLNPYTNSLDFFCRFHKFIKFSADLSSGYIIVCISFDRFMRIARPHRGFSLPRAKIAVICVSVVSVLLCSMTLFVYGSETVPIESHPGLTGVRCGINQHAQHTVVPLVFYITVLVCFGVGVLILLTVYTRLGIKVRKWNKGRKEVKQDRQSTLYTHGYPSKEESSSRMETTPTPDWHTPDMGKQGDMFTFPSVVFEECEHSDTENEISSPRTQVSYRADFVRQISRSLDQCNIHNLDLTNPTENAPLDLTKNNNVPDFKSGHAHVNGTRTLPLPRSNKLKPKPTVKNIRRKSSMLSLTDLKRRMKLSKTTIMFMVATAAFVVSHIPYVCAVIVIMVYQDAVKNMTPAGVSLFRIAQHSYIISYAANPLIYSFMNPKFRKECKTLVIKVAQKVKCHSKSFDLRH